MSFDLALPSPVQALSHPLLDQKSIKVWIKRDDLIHPVLSGNKWRKLVANVEHCKDNNIKSIISFGGAYSNHIHALAYVGKQFSINTRGIIRGEAHYADNHTLRWARHWGMELEFVDRKTYRLRDDAEYIAQLQQRFANAVIIPEGGSNALALNGVGNIIKELAVQVDYQYLLCPVGSGGTIAGLINAADNKKTIIGISALKQDGYLNNQVTELIADKATDAKWEIRNDYHCGGYGKFKPQHLQQMIELKEQLNIPLEPVYSGKMMLGFWDLLRNDHFPPGSRIVLLHTGGLQGLGGMAERGLIDGKQWPVPGLPAGD